MSDPVAHQIIGRFTRILARRLLAEDLSAADREKVAAGNWHPMRAGIRR